MSISNQNKIDVKSKALTGQRVIKITRNGEDVFIPVGLSSLNPNGGDSTGGIVKYGYWNADGKFQEVDLSVDPPVDSGSPIAVDAVVFDTGKESPDYGGGGIEFYECASISSGDSSWSGYKMAWSDGEAGDDIIVSNYPNSGDTFTLKKSDTDGWIAHTDSTPNHEEYGIRFVTDDVMGDIYPGWCFYHAQYSESLYVNTTAGADASIEEIVKGPWEKDYGTDGPPTFESTGTPAGWTKTDALVEGLEVKGYTPEVGKVYAADSTINGNMYPAEIPAGGLSKPTPGAVNVAVVLRITYDNGTIAIVSFSPEDLAASDNDRRWVGIALDGNIWILSNEGDWCVTDANREYKLYGVISSDPWDGDWSTVKSNIGNVIIECIAIEA